MTCDAAVICSIPIAGYFWGSSDWTGPFWSKRNYDPLKLAAIIGFDCIGLFILCFCHSSNLQKCRTEYRHLYQPNSSPSFLLHEWRNLWSSADPDSDASKALPLCPYASYWIEGSHKTSCGSHRVSIFPSKLHGFIENLFHFSFLWGFSSISTTPASNMLLISSDFKFLNSYWDEPETSGTSCFCCCSCTSDYHHCGSSCVFVSEKPWRCIINWTGWHWTHSMVR